MGDVERINKETGELSASGELAVSVELKGEKEGGTGDPLSGPQPLQILRERLQVLGTNTPSASDHIHNHVPNEQRQECLLQVLPLYIQVSTHTHIHTI